MPADRHGFVLNAPPLVEAPGKVFPLGRILYWIVTFLSREKKSNQKKTPVSRFTLRVVVAAGARGNSPACGRLKQSACFIPAAPPMLGAGQRGKTGKPNRFKNSLPGGYLRPPALPDKPHFVTTQNRHLTAQAGVLCGFPFSAYKISPQTLVRSWPEPKSTLYGWTLAGDIKPSMS